MREICINIFVRKYKTVEREKTVNFGIQSYLLKLLLKLH